MQLYNDDCMNVLKKIPDKSIDLIITDPPYDMEMGGMFTGGGCFGPRKNNYLKELKNGDLV